MKPVKTVDLGDMFEISSYWPEYDMHLLEYRTINNLEFVSFHSEATEQTRAMARYRLFGRAPVKWFLKAEFIT